MTYCIYSKTGKRERKNFPGPVLHQEPGTPSGFPQQWQKPTRLSHCELPPEHSNKQLDQKQIAPGTGGWDVGVPSGDGLTHKP